MKLNDVTYVLIDALKATPEFATLKQYKEIIDKNGSLRNKLLEFNKKQMDLYNGKISSKESELRVYELEENYRDLSKIKEIGDYLKASKQFYDKMGTAFKLINDSIEKDIKFK